MLQARIAGGPGPLIVTIVEGARQCGSRRTTRVTVRWGAMRPRGLTARFQLRAPPNVALRRGRCMESGSWQVRRPTCRCTTARCPGSAAAGFRRTLIGAPLMPGATTTCLSGRRGMRMIAGLDADGAGTTGARTGNPCDHRGIARKKTRAPDAERRSEPRRQARLLG